MQMETVKIDFGKTVGTIKPMHSVNNGPTTSRGITNNETYRAAGIPYARIHDAAFYAGYGGEHIVDVHAIFPDFGADANDPASYDFTLTDEYLESIMGVGTKVFYRLGSKIEHSSKKYGVNPPPDFQKWAVICEHIIRHCNEGWADGHHYGIEYWEIWNEPDLAGPCWTGTDEQFFKLFETAALHLKACFPQLKIGGPAVCRAGDEAYIGSFLKWMASHGVPLDFFSWHIYCIEPELVSQSAALIRSLLDNYGYSQTESILNEWNYITAWNPAEAIVESYRTIGDMKGAAFTAAVMCEAQNAPVDQLMYYDAQPNTPFNGMFSPYLFEPLKGYYPFPMFHCLYRLGKAVAVDGSVPGLYAIAAKGDGGEAAVLVACYDGEAAQDAVFQIGGLPPAATARFYLLDETRDMELVREEAVAGPSCSFELPLERNTVLLIQFKQA